MSNQIGVNYHQAQAIAERAARVRKLARHHGYGYTGSERVVVTIKSLHGAPETHGLWLEVDGKPATMSPLFAKDLGHERNFDASRLPARDENGHVFHPDMDGIGFDEFDMGPQLRALGWHSTTVCFESDASHEQQDRYSDSGSPDCSYWAPSRPDGDGWLLAAIYDTEDGPVALYVRSADDAPDAGRTGSETSRADTK